jgi:hypothetical protein
MKTVSWALAIGISAGVAGCGGDPAAPGIPGNSSGGGNGSGGSGGNANNQGSGGSVSGGSAGSGGTNGSTGTSGSNGSGGTGGSGGSGSSSVGSSGTGGSTGTGPSGSGGSGGAGGSAGTGATTGAGGTTSTGGAAGATGTPVTPPPGTNTGAAPAGYWTSKDWHGCAWTGKGTFGATTIAPQDFVAKAAGAPYCIGGVVGQDAMSRSVALLGFNVNEPTSATCNYKPVDTTAAGPAAVVPTGDGVAVNFVKRGTDTSFTLRVQIQGPNGAKDGPAGDADRWCATITEVQGKIFVPYSAFTPSCWQTTAALKGTPYAKQPISAVVFTVPGKLTDTPYDFCANGVAYGTSAADAPDGTAVAGEQKGTVGGPKSPDEDFARAKVTVGGQSYIIQNNNWGNPTGTDLVLNYTNNSFKIASGSGTGADAPASFPSIYIGNNGNTANGVYSTKGTDNLPAQISAITSIPSTFRYSGTTDVFNAAYDIWFSNSAPTTEYKDGLSGFVMVWLRDPSGKQPIGTRVAQGVMVAGQAWDVWVGPRGAGPNGNNNAPVVSFVNPVENDNSRSQSFVNVNLKAFFTAAATYGIPSTMYLTDVFAGFEIWQGGAGGNLGVDEYKILVNK